MLAFFLVGGIDRPKKSVVSFSNHERDEAWQLRPSRPLQKCEASAGVALYCRRFAIIATMMLAVCRANESQSSTSCVPMTPPQPPFPRPRIGRAKRRSGESATRRMLLIKRKVLPVTAGNYRKPIGSIIGLRPKVTVDFPPEAPQSDRGLRPKVTVDCFSYPQALFPLTAMIVAFTGGGLCHSVIPPSSSSKRAAMYCVCTRRSVRSNTSRNLRIRS
jgi:hypothetical protein